MGDVLKKLRERSQKRKLLLAQTVSIFSSNFIFLSKHNLKKYFFNFLKQLGLNDVKDLKHVLGTAEENPSQKHTREDDPTTSKKSQSENIFYRDSSTFLKVYIFLIPNSLNNNFTKKKIREHNHQIHIMITVNILSILDSDHKILFVTLA